MKDVLLTAPYMIPFVDRFKPVFMHYGINLIIPEVNERLEEAQLLEYAGKFDGAITGDDRYTRLVIEKSVPRLKVIAKWGTGIDSIDRQACLDNSVQLLNTVNAFTLPVADSVLGYILSFARRLPWMDTAVKSGTWHKIPGRSLSECTLGVIGIGNIGKAVIQRARGFGMRLLGNDILPIPREFLEDNGVESVDLQTLLREADFISINCDLNPTSRYLINHDTLGLMKNTAVLVNTARGPIVDEAALIEALRTKKIAGAGLDVFEHEPLPPDSPLLIMENVMLAPHNSNSSPTAWENVHWNTIRNLLKGLGIMHEDFKEVQKNNKEVSNP